MVREGYFLFIHLFIFLTGHKVWHSVTLPNHLKPFGLQLEIIKIFSFPGLDIYLNAPHLCHRKAVRRKKGSWDECGKDINKTGNWGLKSANNHWMWMCPLKHSFGCYPDALTNGLFHWSSSRNANLLNASQLRASMAAFPFVMSVCLCVPRCHYPLSGGGSF